MNALCNKIGENNPIDILSSSLIPVGQDGITLHISWEDYWASLTNSHLHQIIYDHFEKLYILGLEKKKETKSRFRRNEPVHVILPSLFKS